MGASPTEDKIMTVEGNVAQVAGAMEVHKHVLSYYWISKNILKKEEKNVLFCSLKITISSDF